MHSRPYVPEPAKNTQAITDVAASLNSRYRLQLRDGRVFEGRLVCLDKVCSFSMYIYSMLLFIKMYPGPKYYNGGYKGAAQK